MNKALFNIHGIGAFIKSNNSDFIDFVKKNFIHYKSEKTKIRIDAELEYFRYNPLRVPRKKLLKTENFDCIGAGIFTKDNELYIEQKKLQIHILFNEKIKIRARFCEDKFLFLMTLLMPKLTVRKHQFQGIMRYLLLFPLFWLLEKEKGYFLLHASAVEKNGKAIIFTGLPGVGKTTMAISLVLSKGFRFLSDNFLLFDNEKIYPLIEMLRLPRTQAIALKKKLVQKGKFQLFLNRRFYYSLNKEHIAEDAIPKKIFLLRFSENTELKKIPNNDCANLLFSINNSTPEIHDYCSYSYLLSRATNYTQKIPDFNEFLKKIDCCSFNVNKKESLEDIYKAIS